MRGAPLKFDNYMYIHKLLRCNSQFSNMTAMQILQVTIAPHYIKIIPKLGKTFYLKPNEVQLGLHTH